MVLVSRCESIALGFSSLFLPDYEFLAEEGTMYRLFKKKKKMNNGIVLSWL